MCLSKKLSPMTNDKSLGGIRTHDIIFARADVLPLDYWASPMAEAVRIFRSGYRNDLTDVHFCIGDKEHRPIGVRVKTNSPMKKFT